MSVALKVAKFIVVISIFAAILSWACTGGGSSSKPTSQPATPPAPPVTAPPVQNPAPAGDRVEVIYTHMVQRCVTCLCFESRIKWVVNTYFKDELSSGKLSFLIINAQETKNAALVKKLGVVGSQLFVNTIIDGADHIKNIEEIWNWNCNDDPPGFNEKVRNVIAQSLEGKF